MSDQPNETRNESVCIGLWTYSSYRATLRKDGQFFAVVSPNGNDALHPNDAVRLVETLQRGEKAAELERELTSAKARVKELEQRNGIQSEMIEILRRERDTLRERVKELEERDKQWADKWRATVDTVGNLNAKIVEQDAVISHVAEHCQQKDQLRAELALAVKCAEALKESTFPEHGKHGGPLVRVAAFYEDGTEESKYHGVNTNATNSTAAYDKFKEENP